MEMGKKEKEKAQEKNETKGRRALAPLSGFFIF